MSRGQPQPFGTVLKRYRVVAGLTQEALAERAHLSARAISDLERGVYQTPRYDTLHLLAAALSLSAREHATFVAAARPPVLDGVAPRPQAGTWPPAGLADDTVPLVGRVRELALLERHLATAHTAERALPVLLLAGEPGIGKSRLLQEAARRAVALGWRVLADGCQRRGAEPYAPLLAALQRHLAEQEPLQLRAELAGCAWLVRLLPELADGPIQPLPSWALPPEQERRLLFAAVRQVLANVAGPAGTLLVLDDLQWAGPDALDLLASVVREAGMGPVRVVGAYRDTEADPGDPLAALLADLAHAGLATQHTLHPLTSEEAGGLLDALLEGADDAHAGLRDQVVQRAGGVPFFLVSWARALRAGPAEERRAETLPWDVAQSVRQRVSTLSGTAREVLGVAAVVGRVVPRALLVAATAQPADELVEALDSVCQARVLDEQGTDSYQFAHDVIREVVEGDLSAARRALLHQRVAVALEQAPGAPPIEALAYHYARSDDQAKAVQYLEEAADLARAQYANAAAEDAYRTAVVLLDRLGRAGDAARVREKWGVTLHTMARYDAALPILEQAAETYRAAGDLERLGRVATHIGWIHADRSTPEDGLAYLQPVLALLTAGGSAPVLAALYAALAGLYYFSGQYEAQLAAAERAADLAQVAGAERTPADAAVAAVYRGLALWELGQVPEALRACEEGIVRAEAAGNLHYLCYALNLAGGLHLDGGAVEQSWIYNERALSIAERQGDPAQIALITTVRGHLAFVAGDWPRARQEYERAETLSHQFRVHFDSVWMRCKAGELCLYEGAWDEASRYLDDALSLAHSAADRLDVQSILAERDLMAGHPEAAYARLSPLRDLREGRVVYLLPRLAWAHLDLGQSALAGDVATEAVTRARAAQDRLALLDALRVQALVALRQERWDVATAALEEGLALARQMPYPYAEARLLHTYGEMHSTKGDTTAACERLQTALAIFRRLGARNDGQRVEQAMASLSRAP